MKTVELDASFDKKTAGKGFNKIIEICAARFTEISLSALVRFDALFTDAIDELVTYLKTS